MLTPVLTSCALTSDLVPPSDGAAQVTMMATAAAAQSTSRTQTVGLPLSRRGKIGLWAGVAVFLAYLMATDGEEDATIPSDP
jgi:hypothetical protein